MHAYIYAYTYIHTFIHTLICTFASIYTHAYRHTRRSSFWAILTLLWLLQLFCGFFLIFACAPYIYLLLTFYTQVYMTPQTRAYPHPTHTPHTHTFAHPSHDTAVVLVQCARPCQKQN